MPLSMPMPALLLLKVLEPSLHKVFDGPLGLLHRLRREVGSGLVGEDAVLIPVVHTVLDQDKGLADCALAVLQADGVGSSRAPWVLLAVDDGQARVADAKAAVLVDGLNIRRLVDVEGLAASNGCVVEVDGAGDQRELVARNAGAGLEVAPSVRTMLVKSGKYALRIVDLLIANLVHPQAPRLLEIVLLVELGVVGGEAGILVLVARLNLGDVDIADVVQELVRERLDLLAISADSQELLDILLKASSLGVQQGIGADIVAVLAI